MSPSKKTKIVLDADVIIHFIKGEHFSTLLEIFPEYYYIVLDVVYDELNHSGKSFIDKFESLIKRITIVKFAPTGSSIKEYACLKKERGRGESACMIYCKDNKDVLGSSNLKDIADFCKEHDITYLTTLDFLYYAFAKGKMTRVECDKFIQDVKAKGSILPDEVNNIETYVCNVAI